MSATINKCLDLHHILITLLMDGCPEHTVLLSDMTSLLNSEKTITYTNSPQGSFSKGKFKYLVHKRNSSA
jgi:hypothetical protein